VRLKLSAYNVAPAGNALVYSDNKTESPSFFTTSGADSRTRCHAVSGRETVWPA